MISLVVSGGGESSLKYAIDDTSTMTTTPSATHRRLRLRTRTRGREAPESTCSALGPPPPGGSFSNQRKTSADWYRGPAKPSTRKPAARPSGGCATADGRGGTATPRPRDASREVVERTADADRDRDTAQAATHAVDPQLLLGGSICDRQHLRPLGCDPAEGLRVRGWLGRARVRGHLQSRVLGPQPLGQI